MRLVCDRIKKCERGCQPKETLYYLEKAKHTTIFRGVAAVRNSDDRGSNEVLHQFKLYDIFDDRKTETTTKVGQFPCT